MSAVSLREDDEERLEEGRSTIPQVTHHPVERQQTLEWRDYFMGRVKKKSQLSLLERKKIEQRERRQERLSRAAERLKAAGERIQREVRRIDYAKSPLGRAAERLKRGLTDRLRSKGLRPL